jgi:hypothetical protein
MNAPTLNQVVREYFTPLRAIMTYLGARGFFALLAFALATYVSLHVESLRGLSLGAVVALNTFFVVSLVLRIRSVLSTRNFVRRSLNESALEALSLASDLSTEHGPDLESARQEHLAACALYLRLAHGRFKSFAVQLLREKSGPLGWLLKDLWRQGDTVIRSYRIAYGLLEEKAHGSDTLHRIRLAADVLQSLDAQVEARLMYRCLWLNYRKVKAASMALDEGCLIAKDPDSTVLSGHTSAAGVPNAEVDPLRLGVLDLEELSCAVEAVRQAVERFEQTPTENHAEGLCMASRHASSLFLPALENSAEYDAALFQELENLLNNACRAIEEMQPLPENARQYARNIRRRAGALAALMRGDRKSARRLYREALMHEKNEPQSV